VGVFDFLSKWLRSGDGAEETEARDGVESDENDEVEPDAGEILNVEGTDYMYWQSENNRMPHAGFHGQLPQADRPAMRANEVVGYDMLCDYAFSHAAMARDGVLGDFLELGIAPVTEVRWRADIMRQLLDAAPEQPELLDDVAALAAEYGDGDALRAAMEALDTAVTRERVGADVLLERCGRILDAGLSGPGALTGKEADRLREAAGELIDRIEYRGDGSEALARSIERARARLEEG